MRVAEALRVKTRRGQGKQYDTGDGRGGKGVSASCFRKKEMPMQRKKKAKKRHNWTYWQVTASAELKRGRGVRNREGARSHGNGKYAAVNPLCLSSYPQGPVERNQAAVDVSSRHPAGLRVMELPSRVAHLLARWVAQERR